MEKYWFWILIAGIVVFSWLVGQSSNVFSKRHNGGKRKRRSLRKKKRIN